MRQAHGRQAAIDHQQALNATVDEVIATAAAEGIDADIVKGGELNVAYTPAQQHAWWRAARGRRGLARRRRGAGSRPTESAARVNVAGTLGGIWHPHCARIHPAKLARGLSVAIEKLGVAIYEGTTVTEIRPGAAITDHGTVSADYVLRTTEGFTANLPRRAPDLAADELVDDRHRAAACVRVGRDRLGREGDTGRLRPRVHVRPADGR